MYIIAECGQNHNGDIKLAHQLIDMAATPIYFEGVQIQGVDAVKFVKRELTEEMTESEWHRPYNSPHAYGATYGEHRRALELTYKEHGILAEYAHSKGLEFIDTICSIGALKVLEYADLDAIKIASRDLTNLPLIKAVAETGKPIILSVGMHGDEELLEALQLIKPSTRTVIMHCLSQYPAKYEYLQLHKISAYLESPKYESCAIGYSDHTTGTQACAWAVVLGAAVVEKHITLDRQMKGTDHAGAMDHEGLRRVVRDCRNAWRAVEFIPDRADAVAEAKEKLERSIAARRKINIGDIITEDDLILLSPGTGLRWRDRGMVIGRRSFEPIERHELILPEYLTKAKVD